MIHELGTLLKAEFGSGYEDLTTVLPRHTSLHYDERPLTHDGLGLSSC